MSNTTSHGSTNLHPIELSALPAGIHTRQTNTLSVPPLVRAWLLDIEWYVVEGVCTYVAEPAWPTVPRDALSVVARVEVLQRQGRWTTTHLARPLAHRLLLVQTQRHGQYFETDCVNTASDCLRSLIRGPFESQFTIRGSRWNMMILPGRYLQVVVPLCCRGRGVEGGGDGRAVFTVPRLQPGPQRVHCHADTREILRFTIPLNHPVCTPSDTFGAGRWTIDLIEKR